MPGWRERSPSPQPLVSHGRNEVPSSPCPPLSSHRECPSGNQQSPAPALIMTAEAAWGSLRPRLLSREVFDPRSSRRLRLGINAKLLI
jgi:hypothetical protein